MTNTSTDGIATRAGTPVDEVIAAARDLAKAGRWRRATSLLDATTAADAEVHALLALAAAEVALERDWFCGSSAATGRLSTAEELCAAADLDPDSRWDLAFLQLRHGYFDQVLSAGSFHPGPEGKDPDLIAGLRRRADDLRTQAPDGVRRGWAEMYLGLIADNLRGERDAAPAHYEAALRGGESGDDLLAREALRHLGDHDHDRGDHQLALERWSRATTLGARAGAVPGTLSQQMLLAVLARDTGDEAGAAALAREIARWAAALGAERIEAQATGFLAGADPTAPPENHS
jgi:tetratricopeptide (TPR) repeat protein